MKCYNHPEIEAIGFCTSCNKAICDECAVDIQGKLLCRECIAAGKIRNQETTEITDNDKTMALLAHMLGLIVPLIILLSESKKNRSFQHYHAINSLMFSGLVFAISLVFVCPISILVGALSFGIGDLCFIPIYLVVFGFQIYFGLKPTRVNILKYQF